MAALDRLMPWLIGASGVAVVGGGTASLVLALVAFARDVFRSCGG
jgi:hypothetical protein